MPLPPPARAAASLALTAAGAFGAAALARPGLLPTAGVLTDGEALAWYAGRVAAAGLAAWLVLADVACRAARTWPRVRALRAAARGAPAFLRRAHGLACGATVVLAAVPPAAVAAPPESPAPVVAPAPPEVPVVRAPAPGPGATTITPPDPTVVRATPPTPPTTTGTTPPDPPVVRATPPTPPTTTGTTPSDPPVVRAAPPTRPAATAPPTAPPTSGTTGTTGVTDTAAPDPPVVRAAPAAPAAPGGRATEVPTARVGGQPVAARHHVVVAGDNLWRIAAAEVARATGAARAPDAAVLPYWRVVVAANRATLRSGDPSLVFPGEVVTLPPHRP